MTSTRKVVIRAPLRPSPRPDTLKARLEAYVYLIDHLRLIPRLSHRQTQAWIEASIQKYVPWGTEPRGSNWQIWSADFCYNRWGPGQIEDHAVMAWEALAMDDWSLPEARVTWDDCPDDFEFAVRLMAMEFFEDNDGDMARAVRNAGAFLPAFSELIAGQDLPSPEECALRTAQRDPLPSPPAAVLEFVAPPLPAEGERPGPYALPGRNIVRFELPAE